MNESLTVHLGERSYPIFFGTDVFSLLEEKLRELRAEGRKVAVLTDEHVRTSQSGLFARLFADLPLLAVAPGEESKSLATYGKVLDFLAAQHLDRSSVLVVFGGGVIGDLGGFAAASYLRGIDFLQVPTTLLSMVDSSVGGKTGINLQAGKNLVGAFHQPKAVYISTDVLKTLPEREFAAGMAEVIKYGLLADSDLFAQLERTPLLPGAASLPAVIQRCCAIKARIVEADERELAKEGGRALLNLGHTFGHAIEKIAGFGVYLHGEAVAVGLCAAARLSLKLGFIDSRAVARVDAVIKAHALPAVLRSPLAWSSLAGAMGSDKKVRAGKLRFVVLRGIGDAVTQGDIDPSLPEASFREVGAR